MNLKFDTLKSYFDMLDYHKDYAYLNEIGSFIPSSLQHINTALEHIINVGMIDPTKLFLDAGCGDGRIVALTGGVHGIPSIGIEYDPLIFQQAKQHLKQWSNSHIKIVCGDFEKDATYHKIGVHFEEIATIFNYINNVTTIATKIARQSPIGTCFLLYDSRAIAQSFSELRLIENITLSDESGVGYLHVYKKQENSHILRV